MYLLCPYPVDSATVGSSATGSSGILRPLFASPMHAATLLMIENVFAVPVWQNLRRCMVPAFCQPDSVHEWTNVPFRQSFSNSSTFWLKSIFQALCTTTVTSAASLPKSPCPQPSSSSFMSYGMA